MKYGLRLHSTMTESTSYVIADTEDEIYKAFELFRAYLKDENKEWIDYCLANDVFCDEDGDYFFMVGKLPNGNHVLITDLDCKRNEDNTTFEFRLIMEYKDRF